MPMPESDENKLITLSVRTLWAIALSLVLTVTSFVMGYNRIIQGQQEIAVQLQLNNQEQKYINADQKKDLNALELRISKMEK